MKPIPYIPENESLTDLLDLVGSSAKFKERVKQLKEIQDAINKDLGDRSRIVKLDDLTQAAAGKLADASQTKANADAYAKAEREKANANTQAQLDRLERVQKESEARSRLIAERERKVDAREQELTAVQSNLVEREKATAALAEHSKALMEQAIKIQAQYENKMSQLKQLAG